MSDPEWRKSESGLHRFRTNGANAETEPVEAIKRTGVSWWDQLPAAIRIGVYMLLGSGGGAGALWALIPFEGKEDAATAHRALQAQIDTLKTELPVALVVALDKRDEEKAAKAEAARAARRHR